MKLHKNKCFRLLAICLVSLFFVGALPWRELRADANTHGEYDGYPLSITYDQTASWDLNTQGEFVLTNVSESVVENWTLEIVFASDLDITNLWNGQDLSDEITPANTLVIGNEIYNATIAPGESVSFGMEMVGTEFAPVAPISVNLTNVVLGEVSTEDEGIPSEETVEEVVPAEEEAAPVVIVEDENSLFPYAIFAESDISFNGWKSTVTGDIYSGGNYLYQGSELYIDGYVRTVGTIQPQGWTTSMTGSTENIEAIPMPDWSSLILSKAELMDTLTIDDISSQNAIVANGFYRTEGSVTINGSEFGGDVVIVAAGDITLNIDTVSGDGRILLYSETGNITINGSQAVFNGILYAPNGSISLNAYDITVNGRIVANTFSYSGSILNVTADDTDLQLYEELPSVNVSAWDSSATEGDRIGYTITVPEESSYEILYRLNGERITVDMPENETTGYYSLTANEEGEYTLEAYVSLPYGEFALDSATITVTGIEPTATPTAVPTETPAVTPTSTPVPTVTVTPIPTVVPIEVPTITPTPSPTITVTPVPTPTPIAIDEEFDLIDTDHDGLLDYLEIICGTDINNPDTDGDGLLDGDEMFVESEPLIPDTDQDGLIDSDEDYDSDGLTNGQEYNTNTCMFLYDTDFDGINDYDELYVYGTDPRNEDSDSDSIVDGDELVLGLIPDNADSDGDGTNDEYELFEQSLSIDITAEEHPHGVTSVGLNGSISGLINSNTTIEDMYNQDVYCTDVVGLVGVPISIESNGHFDSMTLTFNYDDNELGETAEEDLGVLWHDESTGFFVVQSQARIDAENNTVTVELSHFSTYLLVDLRAYQAAITAVGRETNQYESEDVNYNIMFAIDTSAAMDADERNEAIVTINSILGDLEPGDRVSFCIEESNSFRYSNYVDASRVTALSASWERIIRTQRYTGQSNMAKFSDAAADIFYLSGLADSDTNVNLIIYITDDNSTYNTGYGGVHVIGPLNNYYALFVGNTSNLVVENACSRLRGWSCQASSNRAHQIVQHGNSGGTALVDNDGDGILDILEVEGILATNGHKYYSDPEREDSEDDTLSDSEEFGAIYSVSRSGDGRNLTISINGAVVYTSQYGSIPSDSQFYFLESFANTVQPGETAEICVPLSNPNMPDSDEDGFMDYEDARPNVVNPDMIYVFANPDRYEIASNQASIYRSYGMRVRYNGFSDITSFEYAWNGIGLQDEYYINGNKPYGEKYYYNPKYVVIVTHGNAVGFCLGDIDWGDSCERMFCTDYYREISAPSNALSPSDLSDKKIESLNLYSCSAGADYSGGDNIAVDFLNRISGIHQVIAGDATVWFYGINQYFFKDYNSTEVIDEELYFRLRTFTIEVHPGDTLYDVNLGHHINGFEVFTRDNPPTDYYSTDVIYGTLQTSESYQDNEGIIVFDPSIRYQLGDACYDPVIN